MKRIRLAIVTTLVLAFAPQVTLAKNEPIVFSLTASPFEIFMQRTAIKIAKDMDLDLQVLDAQGSSPKQAADLENAITKGTRGFIVSPNDVDALNDALQDIQKANLPVVTLDRSANTSQKIPHFGANNYLGGYSIADYVKQKFPDGADIILLTGQPGSSSNIERTRGIRDSLKAGGEKYRLIADQSGNWMRSQGLSIIESLLPSLAKRPQVIISANDDMALGAIEALRNLGMKPGEIMVTGFDAVPEALLRVKEGWLEMTADQRPGYAVELALSQLAANIRQNKPITGVSYPPVLIFKKNLHSAERIAEANL